MMKKLWVLLVISIFGLSLWYLLAPQEMAKIDKREILNLLKAEKFDVLETVLVRFQNEYEAGLRSEVEIMKAFRSFANSDIAIETPLQHWVEMFPESFAAHQALAEHHLQSAWHARGSRWIKDTTDEQINGMQSHFNIAYREALQALTLHKKLIPAYLIIIRLANASGAKEIENQAIMEALKEQPNSYLVHYNALFALEPKWGGSFEEINAYLQQVEPYYSENMLLASLEGFPHSVRANILRINASSDEDYRIAEQEIDKALAFGENPMYEIEKADIYKEQGRYQEAITIYFKALKRRSQSAAIFSKIAYCFFKLKDYEHALKNYNAAIEFDELDPEALRRRGEVHYVMKSMVLAKEDLQNSFYFAPQNKQARRYLAYIYYGEKDFYQAESAFLKTIELGSQEAMDWFLLTVSQWKNENCDFVKTAQTYAQLCQESGGCKNENIRWINSNVNFAIQKGICH